MLIKSLVDISNRRMLTSVDIYISYRILIYYVLMWCVPKKVIVLISGFQKISLYSHKLLQYGPKRN